MSIEQLDKVDLIGTDSATGEVVLTISDHLAWGQADHLDLLVRKVEAYISFHQSGQLLESRPDAAGRRVRITLVHKHEPTAEALLSLARLRQAVVDAGVAFNHRSLPEGQSAK